MTRQEIFNKAYLGLASQGFKQSKNTTGHCVYRGDDNFRCAIGWLIPDDGYSPGMEGRRRDAFTAAGVYERFGFAVDLQLAHDEGSSATPDGMKARLARFAVREGLTIPEVTA